eukprot:TRINITY_DN27401_c0_g1_i1.p1 TRINITY_DN27401_c0_g1~~TRINITY_DN27401_c0_g1_i1.p1  ORF type:complete len:983 (-),score=246.68 TRINITY_DN27401_c0_g1_i1:73-3021(-)
MALEISAGDKAVDDMPAFVKHEHHNQLEHAHTVQDVINASLKHDIRDHIDSGHPLHRIAFSATEEVEIFRGRFSWLSAFMMCVFIICCFASMILIVLSFQNTMSQLVATEISYISCPNPPWPVPPWGYVLQPNEATERKIGRAFSFAMPQTTLFYSIFSACFGLFTVSYFCSELLIQDVGVYSVKMMGEVINRGVDMFLIRTVPWVYVLMVSIGTFLYFIAGTNFVIALLIGGSSCQLCANIGTNMNFEGGPRLTHAFNYDLSDSVNLGIRIGAIGGIAAHAMAQLGVVMIWILFRDAKVLVGFGAGVSVVAFYNRVGGGIFSKGSDIGSDFVSEMLGEDVDDFNKDAINEMRKQYIDKDGDGEFDDDAAARNAMGDPSKKFKEEDAFITAEEAKIRARIEEQMEKDMKEMHPVNYLDAIGENIADVGGTASDLYETMVITLATSVNFGSRAHEVPYYGTSLPFIIISTGTLCCATVSYFVWAHETHSSSRIRQSLRVNLLAVILLVELNVCAMNYFHWAWWGTLSFDRMINYDVIAFCGLVSPEICAYICEYFTSVNFAPVRWLATNAHLGMIQVILQGLGQGFFSAGAPSLVNIIVQIMAYRLEGFYGLMIIACASQACTGWQATIAAFGAVANNANRICHLTTVNEVAHHRSNVCAVIGTTTSHNGKCVAGQNAFFATSALLASLMADKYTTLGKNFQSITGQEMSQWSRAGLLSGIIMTMWFLSNTLTSCIKMAKLLVKFCTNNPKVLPKTDKDFPATHITPLKTLVAYCAVESFQLTLSPMMQTAAAPLVVGSLLGFKGLLSLVSGGNSVCFSLNMFLINSGQAWDAARKYVLFGMLTDAQGRPVGAESDLYDTLGIGEQIGGPLEDLAGPALNNFIKFVSVMSFVTSDWYEEFPETTWVYGIAQVIGNFAFVSFLKFGLAFSIKRIDAFFQQRQANLEYEEGTTMLREIEAKEKAIEDRLISQGLAENKKDAIEVY